MIYSALRTFRNILLLQIILKESLEMRENDLNSSFVFLFSYFGYSSIFLIYNHRLSMHTRTSVPCFIALSLLILVYSSFFVLIFSHQFIFSSSFYPIIFFSLLHTLSLAYLFRSFSTLMIHPVTLCDPELFSFKVSFSDLM